ncbi:MAG TPA: SGNH/GDSL hydrolase family protein [Planctomycetota bacterium]|jgi:lysophospholipase L1-like esterase|nr:SGNH/GDSL hydrolase family protein [Planctomycetota bacterium]
MTDSTSLVRRRVWLTILGLPLYLVVAEVAARLWASSRYTPERMEQLTTHSPVRGRFACYPYLPYVLNPAFPGHNALGFRGPPMEAKKAPDVRRLVCLGASTTYGGMNDPEDSYPAQLGKLMAQRHDHWEVVNTGTLGYVSSELLINLELRILPLEPDVVVILPSRNEIVAQTYNNYRSDYTHFRRVGFNFTVSNYLHKELFKKSRLFMLACTVRGERFGWSEAEEHPLYAGLVWENKPTVDEAIHNCHDPERMVTFRRSTESMLELCRDHGITVLMCTMPERPEKYDLDELDHDTRLFGELGQLVERDNQVLREVAARYDTPILEAAPLNEHPELFDDDCHLSPDGHRFQARMVYDALGPLIDQHTKD